jgi:hypothetical protein
MLARNAEYFVCIRDQRRLAARVQITHLWLAAALRGAVQWIGSGLRHGRSTTARGQRRMLLDEAKFGERQRKSP